MVKVLESQLWEFVQNQLNRGGTRKSERDWGNPEISEGNLSKETMRRTAQKQN